MSEAPRLWARSALTPRRGALALAMALGLVWAWWGWRSGAYFGTVFYPGAMAIAALAIALLIRAPIGFRLAGGPAIALLAIGLLAGWTLLSILWTPVRNVAVADAFQVATYGLVFVLGLWLCRLLARDMLLALLPLAIGAAIAGSITLITIWTGDDVARYLHSDASLRYPLGYRNANAAFFLIAFWPALTLAAAQTLSMHWRALLLATATLCIELAVLSQSRGSLIAAAGSVLVYFAFSPWRLRAAAYFGLAVLPALVALPALLDLYQHGDPIRDALPLLRHAATAIAISVGAAIALGAVAVGLEDRVAMPPGASRRAGRAVGAIAAAIAIVGCTAYVAAQGGPIRFIDQRVEEFGAGGNPDLHTQGTRFGANAGSNRNDFWRVAIHEAATNPLAGGGAGSFELIYLKERRSHETPSDPHSIEMLMLSELGIIGLLLLGVFLAGATLGVVRSASLGPGAAALSASALASGAYWLVHASFDWFWNYPAVTAPVICVIGAACGAASLDPAVGLRQRLRRLLAGAIAVVALAAVPLYLSERYTDAGLGEWRADLGRAYEDLARAADLNPLAVQPLLAEAEIARLSGDAERSLRALRRAEARQPENWAPHYLIGSLVIATDPATAARELSKARELNPRGPEVSAAQRRLDTSNRRSNRAGRAQ